MPDMPAQEGQAAPAQAEQGGGVTEALQSVDGELQKILEAVGQSPASDGVKQAFQSAHEAYRAAVESLMAEAQGGAAPQAAGPGGPGTVSPEQGGSGAVPQSHAGMRG